jgi:hypothetical protein
MKAFTKTAVVALSLAGVSGAIALAAEREEGTTADPRRDEFVAACGNDIKTYCADASSRSERLYCVKTNVNNFSDACRTFFERNASVLSEG